MTMPKPPLWIFETNPQMGYDWFNMHFHDELKRPFIYTGGRQPNYANDKTIDGEAFEVSEPKQIEDKR